METDRNSYNLNDDQVRYEFLILNYELIAAIGWKGYLEEGRGCVVIDNSNNQATRENLNLKFYRLLDTVPGFYLGEKSTNFQALMQGKWPDAETSRRVAEYAPESKVLVVVWFAGEKGDFLVQGISIPQMPPPLCYQRFLPRLAEFQLIAER